MKTLNEYLKHLEKDFLYSSEISHTIEVCEYCGTERTELVCCGEAHFKELYIDEAGNEWESDTLIIDDLDEPHDRDR
jgi:hypothetical protein